MKKKNNKNHNKIGIVMKFYRLERFLFTHRMKLLARFIYHQIQILFNCVIPPSVIIGEGTCIAHGVGIVIHHDAIIGKGCKIFQNVTIGQSGVVVGDNVLLGAGAVLLGPVTIGDNVKIGANAVVTKSVPPNLTVVGIPARIVKKEK